MIKKLYHPEFYFFAIVGCMGFLIDSSIFYMLHLKFSYAVSRAISIFVAMTCNWLANRTFTFKMEKKASHIEWMKYAFINTIGALINYGVFLELTNHYLVMKTFFIIPMALATGVSMWFNFFFSKFYVFKKRA